MKKSYEMMCCCCFYGNRKRTQSCLSLFLLVLCAAGSESSVSVPPCLTGWSHLSYSHLCVRLHTDGSALYNNTAELCSSAVESHKTHFSPVLLDFQSVQTSDFHTLDTVVGNSIHQLWFHVASESSPYLPTDNPCLAFRNRTTGESWSVSQNISCPDISGSDNKTWNSSRLQFVCSVSSALSPLNMELMEDRQFSASSVYKDANETFGLLKHEPHHAKINKTFALGFLQGAGWCSSSDAGNGSWWQVDFDGRVLLSGIRLQYGIVSNNSNEGTIEYRSWISKFQVDYHNGEGWLPLAANLTDPVSYDFTENGGSGADEDFWFSPAVEVEQFRIKPIEGRSECTGIQHPSHQFCLRTGFYGYFFRKNLDAYLRKTKV